MANRTKGDDRRPIEEIRKIIEDQLRQGRLVKDAVAVAGRSYGWYEKQRQGDKDWADRIDAIRRSVRSKVGKEVPDFPEFCEQYLFMRLWDHQLAMFDVLEGREPRWCPPGVSYSRGVSGRSRVLINVPPNHAKTMTVTISYVLWRILQDPSLTVLIISKTRDFAAKILWAIKNRLTHPRYADLQLAFGPVEGFKESADQWTQTRIYLFGAERDSQDKDATIEAVGIGGQVYGNRARLVVIDDAALLSNASQWEAQQTWIRQEVASRIGPDDQLVIVGTRVAPIDLYRQLMDPDAYHDGEVPWTVLRIPAVLEYAEEEKDWVTAWPRADIPFSEADAPGEDGMYARWTGPRLARVRNEVGPKRWGLVYQQQDVPDDSTFDPVAVRGSIDTGRGPGQALVAGDENNPVSMGRLFWMLGWDPAVKGTAAFCVYAVDPASGHRWVADIRSLVAPLPSAARNMVLMLVDKHPIREVIVETNSYQASIMNDRILTTELAKRGVVLRSHLTYGNKMDEDYGVAAMSSLFGTVAQVGGRQVHQRDNLVHLPNTATNASKQLVDELVTWSPDVPTRQRKQDHVMAMWFCELRALQIVRTQNVRAFTQGNKFLSQKAKNRRLNVRLSDLAMSQEGGVRF